MWICRIVYSLNRLKGTKVSSLTTMDIDRMGSIGLERASFHPGTRTEIGSPLAGTVIRASNQRSVNAKFNLESVEKRPQVCP